MNLFALFAASVFAWNHHRVMRKGLSMLIHPVQEDELEAHTTDARWLSEKLPLDLKVLAKT